jgi:hypothetical protein
LIEARKRAAVLFHANVSNAAKGRPDDLARVRADKQTLFRCHILTYGRLISAAVRPSTNWETSPGEGTLSLVRLLIWGIL